MVDLHAVRDYLAAIMLARILAAFAFVTGLASIGAPADARMLASISEQVDSASAAQQGSAQAPCPASTPDARLKGKIDPQADCKPRRPVIIYLPTVQYGPDRALE